MEHDGLKAIIDDIEAGNLDDARLALRPYVTGAHDAPSSEVRYALGRAWFDADRATARYFFEEALALDPEFREAGQWEARCGSALEDLEDFRDARHPACETCGLHYRDHEPLCPYCGSTVTPPRDSSSSVEDQFREAGQEVLDSLRAFAERDDVKKAREKAVHAGQQAYARARELAESEKAQQLREKASQLGQRTAAKAREVSERKDVKEAKARASALGKDAADKARAFGEREDVKRAIDRARAGFKKFLERTQAYIKAEQARINAAEGGAKAVMIGKWVVLAVVLLYLLRWLLGGD